MELDKSKQSQKAELRRLIFRRAYLQEVNDLLASDKDDVDPLSDSYEPNDCVELDRNESNPANGDRDDISCTDGL